MTEKNNGSDFSLFKKIRGSEVVFFSKLKSWITLACHLLECHCDGSKGLS